MSEWISVKERMPIQGSTVLVYGLPTCGGCNADWKVREARFASRRRQHSEFEFGEYDCSIEVTYWMPLPEPPKES